MMARARLVITHDNNVAVIERWRDGRHYFVFPGGGIEEGESAEEAAIREAQEELGLRVALRRLVARVTLSAPSVETPDDRLVYVFLAEVIGGAFGTGQGLEMTGARPERGRYKPRWLPVATIGECPVYPRSIARLTVAALATGWPNHTIDLTDEE
jgi:8-oxo-dGTP pyrophosphatase MutT (NUDIX family)